ncbi:hypothetical protein LCGC14_1332030 [marine sediment metagenome]|uniref:Uncharacterized protein n=1 Tax=marine sediment metagenome TaxID=412755 RepID=A0A0F9MX11_9ZZZZ
MVTIIRADARINAQEGDLCTWWVRNPPGVPEYRAVASIDEAVASLRECANADSARPDVACNIGGLEIFEDGDWCEWYGDDGEDIDAHVDETN